MYSNLEKSVGYTFKNKSYLDLAFQHSSYANEKNMDFTQSNERLEFLGDAVLQLAVSDYIYKKYPELSEGDLSKLRANIVCEESFAKNSRELGLGSYLKLGKGEDKSGGRERNSILADTFEAFIGAVYLDSDIFVAEKVIFSIIEDKMSFYLTVYEDSDYKTHLQEIVQAVSKIPLSYEIFKESGPDHDRTFYANVRHGDKIVGTGVGKTKKEAEQQAAANCIDKKIF